MTPKPQYTVWQAISAAIALGTRALEEVRSLARLPGPPGERGERGKDAVSLADIDFTSPDGGRTIVLGFKDGNGVAVIRELKTWAIIDRGIWRNENVYERGDCISSSGSMWIAQDTSIGERPGNGSKAWRLSVKCGRDGKDGQSITGPPGPAGKDGRDLTQMGTNGAKW